jgi:hypothetical protein
MSTQGGSGHRDDGNGRSGGRGGGGEALRAAVLSAALSDLGLYLGSPAMAPPPPPAPAVAAARWPWGQPLAAILRVSGRSLEEAVWDRRAAAEVGLLWRLWREAAAGARGEERLGA